MEDGKSSAAREAEEEEAQVEIWKYVFGFTEMAVVKCAVELGIADLLERQPNQTMSLHSLSSSLACSPSSLYRILRFLTRRRIFKHLPNGQYTQTPLSRLLTMTGENSMAPLLLFESTPTMLAPWLKLKSRVLQDGTAAAPFDFVHGRDIWEFSRDNPQHSELLNQAMSCDARLVVSTILEDCPEVFNGIGTLVDVGGGNGTALQTLVASGRSQIKKGINFDLPHVVAAVAPGAGSDGIIEHVGGDFFKLVPSADAAIIMWVLHDWGDEECIKILKNCRNSVPADTGKVIILEAVIDEDEEYEDDVKRNGRRGGVEEREKKLKDVGLVLDMIMMVHTTTGKERTAKEWAYVLDQAGFSRHTVKRIRAVHSVIEAFP